MQPRGHSRTARPCIGQSKHHAHDHGIDRLDRGSVVGAEEGRRKKDRRPEPQGPLQPGQKDPAEDPLLDQGDTDSEDHCLRGKAGKTGQQARRRPRAPGSCAGQGQDNIDCGSQGHGPHHQDRDHPILKSAGKRISGRKGTDLRGKGPAHKKKARRRGQELRKADPEGLHRIGPGRAAAVSEQAFRQNSPCRLHDR